MKCPLCDSIIFYIKNPDDGYDVYEFTCKDGNLSFADDLDEGDIPSIDDSTEAYCNKCSWHGKIDKSI